MIQKYFIKSNTGKGFCLSKVICQSTGIPYREVLKLNYKELKQYKNSYTESELDGFIDELCTKNRKQCIERMIDNRRIAIDVKSTLR